MQIFVKTSPGKIDVVIAQLLVNYVFRLQTD